MKGNFQIIVLIIFITAGIFGVLVFAGVIPIGKSGSSELGTVVLWGTVPKVTINKSLEDFNRTNSSINVVYEEKSADMLDKDLLEALASGSGPDMVFLPDNLVLSYANKIAVIPYTSYSLATFKSVFAQAGEVFLNAQGVLAFPVTVDPLMMYYDRSLFDSNGISKPPATWNDMADIIPALTKKDEAGKIIKSAVALGHYSNVVHAKDILAALFLQAGNPIVQEKNGVLGSTINLRVGNYNLPSTLKFYTDFADPSSSVYTWNKSFTNSNDAFSREDVAIYFGFASEVASLVNKNPNQNFFVAGIPQIKDASSKATSSRVTGIAILSASKNLNGAFYAASLLATSDFASGLARVTNTAPARRDLLAVKPTDNAFSPVFYNSALFARSWLDPSPEDTDSIFGNMINSVISGSLSSNEAITDANSKMSLLLVK